MSKKEEGSRLTSVAKKGMETKGHFLCADLRNKVVKVDDQSRSKKQTPSLRPRGLFCFIKRLALRLQAGEIDSKLLINKILKSN
jgi:hypothetical protein